MRTDLLRLARKDKQGRRFWSVPGYDQSVILTPGKLSFWPGAAMVRWPVRADNGDGLRGVRLDMHRTIAKVELRALIDGACQ